MKTFRSVLLGGLIFLAIACDTFEAAPVSSDSGVDSGTTVDAASTCATLYVNAEGGLDANSGCSPALAKRTIANALAAARERKGEVQEMRVCKGDYGEPDLTLDQRVSLRGGYACSDFTREPDFGAASSWNFKNPTTVFNSKTDGAPAALTVTGTDVGNSIEVDGFVLRGATASTNLAMALSVESASPTVHDCVLSAQGTKGEGGGVIGAAVRTSSTRFLKNRVLVSGGGTEEVGGQGLVTLSGGTVTVEQNTFDVRGGRGSKFGSVGISASSVLKATGNTIWVEGSPTLAGKYSQSIGVSAAGKEAGGSTIRSNNVFALGSGCAVLAECGVVGIGILSAAAVEVIGNRVMAAAVPGPDGSRIVMAGISLLNADQAMVVSNAVLSDASAWKGDNLTRLGLVVTMSSSVDAVGNSLVFARGTTRAFPEVNLGVQVTGDARPAFPQSRKFTFHRNLLAMLEEGVNQAQRTEFGLATTTCPGDPFGPVPQGNVIVGFSTPATSTRARYATSSGCALESLTGKDALPGNVASSPLYACPASGTVTAAQCVENLFQGLNRSDLAAALLSDKLKLSPSAPCGLAEGGAAFGPEYGFDLLGQARAAPYTPGAYERGACAK